MTNAANNATNSRINLINKLKSNSDNINNKFIKIDTTVSEAVSSSATFKKRLERSTYIDELVKTGVVGYMPKTPDQLGMHNLPSMAEKFHSGASGADTLYKMQTVKSSAHTFREMRKAGQIHVSVIGDDVALAKRVSEKAAASASAVASSSMWTGALAVAIASLGMVAWSYSQPVAITSKIGRGVAEVAVLSSSSNESSTSTPEVSGDASLPLWLQRDRKTL